MITGFFDIYNMRSSFYDLKFRSVRQMIETALYKAVIKIWVFVSAYYQRGDRNLIKVDQKF